MGCDIHLVVERRHPDGTWETVMHDMEAWAGIRRPGLDPDDRRYAIDMRCYTWFGVLSGVRSNAEGPYLATDGFPEDASAFACDAREWCPSSWERQPFADFHSHGWVMLSELIDARGDANALPILADPEIFRITRERVKTLMDLLDAAGPNGPQTIFRGRFNDPDLDTYHPDMANLSHHQRLQLDIRGRELGPLDADATRLLIAYDN